MISHIHLLLRVTEFFPLIWAMLLWLKNSIF